jgi:hypothetical protein
MSDPEGKPWGAIPSIRDFDTLFYSSNQLMIEQIWLKCPVISSTYLR